VYDNLQEDLVVVREGVGSGEGWPGGGGEEGFTIFFKASKRKGKKR
jgi:hypothetical protein